MKLKDIKPKRMRIAILYDAYPLKKVQLDDIRSQTSFELVACMGEEVILLKDKKEDIEAHIQSTQMEYINEQSTDFLKRNLKELNNLFDALPPLSYKAIDIIFLAHGILDEKKPASIYIRDKFLKSLSQLKDTLGKEIIQNSTRIFYGKPEDYYDLRLTPTNFTGPEFYIQLHRHVDVGALNSEALKTKIKSCFKDLHKELNRVLLYL